MDLVVDMSAQEASDVLNVSPRRVQMIAHNGLIHAVKHGRDLRFSRREVDRMAANGLSGGRPYSAVNAWRRVGNGDLPAADAQVMLSRLSRRAQRHMYAAHPSLLERLASDDRLLLSGHSAADVPLGDEAIVEAYVAADDLDDLVAEYRLREPDRSVNVFLRAVPPEVNLPDEVPRLFIALDLLESPLPRVRGVGESLLGDLL
ncbi:MAG: excisionase family DNA binding protein [Glaciecola sp.]|jgi:excisionase family DNA binding protein